MREVYKKTILVLCLLLFVSVSLNFLFPGNPVNIIGKFHLITSKATSQTLSVRVEIVDRVLNHTIPSSGNFTFYHSRINFTLRMISGLANVTHASITFYENTYPSDWVGAAPSSSHVNKSFSYFDLSFDNATYNKNYTVHFSLSQSNLSGVNINNVRLYIFESNWTELNTSVIDANADPVEFYALVPHFSEFLIGEKNDSGATTTTTTTTTTLAAGGGAAGGGGGGGSGGKVEKIAKGTKEVRAIKLNKGVVHIEIEQGSKFSDILKIQNGGNVKIELNLKITPEYNFLLLEEKSHEHTIRLEPGETNNVEVFVNALGLEPGVYVGKINIEEEGIKEIVPVVIDVRSKGKSLFDVDVNILKRYKVVNAGGIVSADVVLFNLGVDKQISAEIEYILIDFDGNVIIKEIVREVVETQFQTVKEIRTMKSSPPGKYVFAVKITYADGGEKRVASSSDVFEITQAPSSQFPFGFGSNIVWVLGGLLILIIILFLVYQWGILRTLKYRRLRENRGRGEGFNLSLFARKQSREFERVLEKQAENELKKAVYKSQKDIDKLKKQFAKKARRNIFKRLRFMGGRR